MNKLLVLLLGVAVSGSAFAGYVCVAEKDPKKRECVSEKNERTAIYTCSHPIRVEIDEKYVRCIGLGTPSCREYTEAPTLDIGMKCRPTK